MERAKLSTLPNECLAMIFDGVFMQDLILLRVVSTRWCRVIEQELANTTKSLKLFGSLDDLKYYCGRLSAVAFNDDVHYWKLHDNDDLLMNAQLFRPQTRDMLLRLFPNVQYLIVCFGTPTGVDMYDLASMSLFEHLPFLLNHWASTLSSLSICGRLELQNVESLSKMYQSIYILKSLKRLDFLVKIHISPNMIDLSVLRFNTETVLPQLEHFSLNLKLDTLIPLHEDFRDLSSPACTHLYLELNHDEFARTFTEHIVTHLTLNDFRFGLLNIGQFEYFCCRFKQLRYLNAIFHDSQSLDVILNLVLKSKNLTELRLTNVTFPFLVPTLFDLIRPMAQVKILSISQINFLSYNLGKKFGGHICRIFPNLEQITVHCRVESGFHYANEFYHDFQHLKKKKIYWIGSGSKYAGRHKERF